MTGRRSRLPGAVWPVVLGSILVLVVGLFNNLVHSRDGWTSVMPMGLALSALTVVVMLVTGWLAVRMGRRRIAAISYAGARR